MWEEPDQIDGRKSCVDFAIILADENIGCFGFAWLGYNLRFLEDKDLEDVLYPIKN